jgi:hypothetical protein
MPRARGVLISGVVVEQADKIRPNRHAVAIPK